MGQLWDVELIAIATNELQATRELIEEAENLSEGIEASRNATEQTKNRLAAVHFLLKFQSYRMVAGAGLNSVSGYNNLRCLQGGNYGPHTGGGDLPQYSE
jgi:hypothetical protein